MKKKLTKSLALLAIVLTAFTGQVSAQVQKIGFVDLTLLIDTISKRDSLFKDAETIQNQYTIIYEKKIKEFQLAKRDYDKYLAEPEKNRLILEDLSKTLQQLQESMGNLEEQAKGSIDELKSKVQRAAYDHVVAIVNTIAKARGYTQVINSEKSVVLFQAAGNGNDLTQAVMIEAFAKFADYKILKKKISDEYDAQKAAYEKQMMQQQGGGQR